MLEPLTGESLMRILSVPGPLQILFMQAPWAGADKIAVFCDTDAPGELVVFTVVFHPTEAKRAEWRLPAAPMFLGAFVYNECSIALNPKFIPLSSDAPSVPELREATRILLVELMPFVPIVTNSDGPPPGAVEIPTLSARPPAAPNRIPDPSLN